MVKLLRDIDKRSAINDFTFNSHSKLRRLDSLLALPDASALALRNNRYQKALTLLELGQEDQAVRILEPIVRDRPDDLRATRALALSYLRLGERTNCVTHHASASCIIPIAGPGIHTNTTGSQKAISLYESVLKRESNDLESRWLLNIAYMTLGRYPGEVPTQYIIRGMEGESDYQVNPFEDIAGDLKLEINNMSGGSIVEDFDNDGYLDVFTSGWGSREELHYFRNRGDGTFENLSRKMGLDGITGGLNIMQMDYNNDGYKDVFVLRGAWRRELGRIPNSLLRNNGNGTFTDVTFESGLLSFHPTQTATFNDFNNDGWLDIFVGNETSSDAEDEQHPCELFINNQDGTFREIAKVAGCDVTRFVKGVTSGDYDNDGWQDLFLSTLDGRRKLLRNMGGTGGTLHFDDVTDRAGVGREKANTFSTWFWDYNNDGWLDIYACDYSFEESLSYDVAIEKLGFADARKNNMLLYHNNGDGTFTNVAPEAGLNTAAFAMGANFGDINNDGFLDMYLGTGNPRYESLVPNRLFVNLQGKQFADVTASARVGHLQKGHGVSFADLDNDGDQDIYIDMGGAYPGDTFQNSLFLNPGQGNNRWIVLHLEGVDANRSAIGTRVKVTFREKGKRRSVYRDVNSGGSFGSSPLRREIGIGQADVIDEIEIRWGGSNKVQLLTDIKANQFLRIREGSENIVYEKPARIQWTLPNRLCVQ